MVGSTPWHRWLGPREVAWNWSDLDRFGSWPCAMMQWFPHAKLECRRRHQGEEFGPDTAKYTWSTIHIYICKRKWERNVQTGLRLDESSRTGAGGPSNEYAMIEGWIMMSESMMSALFSRFLFIPVIYINISHANTLISICSNKFRHLEYAVSSGLLLNTWRNWDRRRWNMNWGYRLNESDRRKLLGWSLLYSPNFWHCCFWDQQNS